MKIRKLPNVLALHLKRFKYQEQVQRYIKLSYRVVFPFQLRLFNTSDDVADPDRLYELFAVVVHIGMWVIRAQDFDGTSDRNLPIEVRTTDITSPLCEQRVAGSCATTKTSSPSKNRTFRDTLATTRLDPDMSCSIRPSTSIWLAWD